MKKLSLFTVIIFIALFSLCVLSGCNRDISDNADAVQAKQTKTSMAEAARELGMPNIVNFQQKKNLKWIYELCDQANLICWAYTYSEYTGKFTFLYKCAGYGIPFSAQYTNPEKLVEGDHYFGYDVTGILNYLNVMPQEDPNGLFMPTSSQATWLIVINPETKELEAHYSEPNIYVSPSKMRASIVTNAEDYAMYDGKLEVK